MWALRIHKTMFWMIKSLLLFIAGSLEWQSNVDIVLDTKTHIISIVHIFNRSSVIHPQDCHLLPVLLLLGTL